jgi:hypothetical protein
LVERVRGLWPRVREMCVLRLRRGMYSYGTPRLLRVEHVVVARPPAIVAAFSTLLAVVATHRTDVHLERKSSSYLADTTVECR